MYSLEGFCPASHFYLKIKKSIFVISHKVLGAVSKTLVREEISK